MTNDYRILSLDGGGSWALIQVQTLQQLYGPAATGHEVLADFDLVAANSGGSIVAAALALDWRLDFALDLFSKMDRRNLIFSKLNPLERITNTVLGVGPKYSAREKLIGYRQIFGPGGDTQLSAIPASIHNPRRTDFLITTFDYDQNRGKFWRSNLASRTANFAPAKPITLSEAIHTSSNAPVNYFDAPALVGNGRYWDGGVAGYNNPVLAGVVEAMANRARPDQRIVALSIGTGNLVRPIEDSVVKPPLAEPKVSAGLIPDVKKMAISILDDPPDAATFIAHVTLGQRLPAPGDAPVTDTCLVRMNPLIQPVWDGYSYQCPIGMDTTEFGKLAGVDMDAVEDDEVAQIVKFSQLWINNPDGYGVPNQPIRAGDHFSVEIGHRTFQQAAAAWRALL